MSVLYNLAMFFSFFCCLQFLPIFAQSTRGVSSEPHPNIYFRSDGARVEIMDYSLSSFQNLRIPIVIEAESGKEDIKILSLPPDVIVEMGTYFQIYCVQDAIFLTTYEKANRTIKLYSASTFSDMKNFELLGSYEHEKQDALFGMFADGGSIIPYKRDKYLFILQGIYNYKPENKKGVKFIEANLKNKKFVLGNYICVDFDGESLLGEGGPFAGARFPRLTDAWFSYSPILLDDHVVLVSKSRGVFWMLDTKTGSVRQKKLYNELTQDYCTNNIIINPIIANVCLSRNDSIIVAARPKKNAFVQMDESTRKSMEGRPFNEQREIRERWGEDNLLKYPQIEWWKLDVKDGTIIPMAQPSGDVPSIIENGTKWSQFKFRVHPDERVTMVK